tara:strand:+ start:537 stop:764 length:228 start_codon:yes stop_codon:yes gene_type:complete
LKPLLPNRKYGQKLEDLEFGIYDNFDYKKLTSNKNVDINYLCKDSLDELKIFLKADQVFELQKNNINFEIKNCYR